LYHVAPRSTRAPVSTSVAIATSAAAGAAHATSNAKLNACKERIGKRRPRAFEPAALEGFG
jgi:hypothetical protein